MFVEVKTDYVDENGVIHIDGYNSFDEDAEGVGVGYIIHGEVYWRNPEYQFDPLVKAMVEEVLKKQPKFVLDNVDYPLLRQQRDVLYKVYY